MTNERTMKTLIMRMHIFLFLGVCLTFAQERSVAILSTAPSLDVNDNNPSDVHVYETDLWGNNSYGIAFFRIEKDTLRHYKAIIGTDEAFDRAFYIWENDSTAAIRLHNTKDNLDKSFKVFGYINTSGNRTTGMSDYD